LGRRARARVSPSAPSWATSTAKPSLVSILARLVRSAGSSSTTRIRAGPWRSITCGGLGATGPGRGRALARAFGSGSGGCGGVGGMHPRAGTHRVGPPPPGTGSVAPARLG
jgi:hypothetical protein